MHSEDFSEDVSLSAEELAKALGKTAHDLNNLCASILGFAALAQESLDAAAPEQEFLAEVMAAAEKTTALAVRLRSLAHAARRPAA